MIFTFLHGLQGAGKTTFAKQYKHLKDNSFHVEVDKYPPIIRNNIPFFDKEAVINSIPKGTNDVIFDAILKRTSDLITELKFYSQHFKIEVVKIINFPKVNWKQSVYHVLSKHSDLETFQKSLAFIKWAYEVYEDRLDLKELQSIFPGIDFVEYSYTDFISSNPELSSKLYQDYSDPHHCKHPSTHHSNG